MADPIDLTYTFITAREDIEWLGGSQTRPVMTVSIQTNGHGVYFEYRIPRNLYTKALALKQGIGWTGTIESMFTVPGVVDEEYTQIPRPSGQLDDSMIVYVESTSGQSSSSLTVPIGKLAPEFQAAAIKALRAELDDAETT